MPKLSSLIRTKTIEINWPDTDETLRIVVRPDELTGSALDAMQQKVKSEEGDETEQLKFMCSFLSTIIKSWDLCDEEGNPLEISELSFFNNLPITVVGLLLQEIQKSLTVSP